MDGGVVLCSNHIAAVDVIAIGCVCPRQLTFVAKKELFYIPILGNIIEKLGAIKVDRGVSDVGAIKASIKAAKNGGVLSIFPQGTRCPGVNPATTPIRHGAGMIAFHSRCDVVPVCIKVKKGKYAFLRPVDVYFGKKIKYSDLCFREGAKEEYIHATEIIFSEICKMGEYDNLPSYDQRKINKKKRSRKK